MISPEQLTIKVETINHKNLPADVIRGGGIGHKNPSTAVDGLL